ncbi:hypothetical protein Esti_006464 [Eimeria stiedai]
MASGARGTLLLRAPVRLVRRGPPGFTTRSAAARPLHARGLRGALPQKLKPTSRQQPVAPSGAAAAFHAATGSALLNAAGAAAAAAGGSCSSTAAVDVGACLSALLTAGDRAAARVAAVKGSLAAFAAAAEAAEAAGLPAAVFVFDLRDPAYSRLLKAAIPATPAAAASAAAASPAAAAMGIWQQQLQQQHQLWDSEVGSPFHVLLLQALRAAALAAGGPASSSSSTTTTIGLEAAAAEVAASWQLQVNKDLWRLRLKAEASLHARAHGEAAAASTAAAATVAAGSAAAAVGASFCMHQMEQVEAAATRLLCSAAEAASLLAEMQLRHSVRDLVPTLLLILERVRLSKPPPQQQQQQQLLLLQQEQQSGALLLEGVAQPSSAGVSSAIAAATAAATAAAAAARAGVQCLHALGRCQLFSEQLMGIVSVDHLPAMEADSLALYLFENGRMGLRCKRWIDACVERAAAAASHMSPASLLLASAGMYRFCVDCRPFYREAAPLLIALLPEMDFYQLRLMLRIVKHLDPSFKEASMSVLARQAASRLERMVPVLQPQQLCCIATFVERTCVDTPQEFYSLTRTLVAALEATKPPRGVGGSAGASPAAAAAAADDPLALVHPVHDLVDVVDCLASHGLQSSLLPRIEAILAARYAEIEHSVNFTLWLVCLDAFSRTRGFEPRSLLQRVVDSLCSSSSSSSLEAPSLLDSLSVVQKLKFMQALTRLSFFSPFVAQMWCRSVEAEPALFKSLRDVVTCVYPLAAAVYIHPVLFQRALRFVESRSSSSSSRRLAAAGGGLYPTERHLEFFYLAHIAWAFVVADMQARPSFVRILDRALAAALPLLTSAPGKQTIPESRRRKGGMPPLAADAAAPVAAATANGDSNSSSMSPFALPWRVQDAAWPVLAAQQQVEANVASGSTTATTATTAAAAAAGVRGAVLTQVSLSPLDVISYHKHCDPVGLLQQVCSLLQLEAPQAVRALKQAAAFEAFAGTLIRWKAKRRRDTQMLLQEVQGSSTTLITSERWTNAKKEKYKKASTAAANAGLQFKESREGGGPPSAAPQWGHQWPLSEVSLWIEGLPLVLQTEAEGLLLHAPPSPSMQQRLYNTGAKYLLLRAFKALGQPKRAEHSSLLSSFVQVSLTQALFLEEDEWKAASGSPQQQQDLLRRKVGII